MEADKAAPGLSDELARELLEAAPDALVVIDESGKIAFVNQQTERLFGYGRDELIGKPIEQLIPERVRKLHVQHRARFAAASRMRPMGSGIELFACRRDGSEFAVEISLSPLRVR